MKKKKTRNCTFLRLFLLPPSAIIDMLGCKQNFTGPHQLSPRPYVKVVTTRAEM